MRICLCFHVLFLRFYRENGGGGRVMDLVYGSSSSLDMNCEMNFVCCYADSPISGLFNPGLLRRFRRWTSSYMDVPSTVHPPAG